MWAIRFSVYIDFWKKCCSELPPKTFKCVTMSTFILTSIYTDSEYIQLLKNVTDSYSTLNTIIYSHTRGTQLIFVTPHFCVTHSGPRIRVGFTVQLNHYSTNLQSEREYNPSFHTSSILFWDVIYTILCFHIDLIGAFLIKKALTYLPWINLWTL
jgi:hypothetical protein